MIAVNHRELPVNHRIKRNHRISLYITENGQLFVAVSLGRWHQTLLGPHLCAAHHSERHRLSDHWIVQS